MGAAGGARGALRRGGGRLLGGRRRRAADRERRPDRAPDRALRRALVRDRAAAGAPCKGLCTSQCRGSHYPSNGALFSQVHGHDFSCVAALPPSTHAAEASRAATDSPASIASDGASPQFTYVSGSEEKVLRVLEAPQAFHDTLALARGGAPRACSQVRACTRPGSSVAWREAVVCFAASRVVCDTMTHIKSLLLQAPISSGLVSSSSFKQVTVCSSAGLHDLPHGYR